MAKRRSSKSLMLVQVRPCPSDFRGCSLVVEFLPCKQVASVQFWPSSVKIIIVDCYPEPSIHGRRTDKYLKIYIYRDNSICLVTSIDVKSRLFRSIEGHWIANPVTMVQFHQQLCIKNAIKKTW